MSADHRDRMTTGAVTPSGHHVPPACTAGALDHRALPPRRMLRRALVSVVLLGLGVATVPQAQGEARDQAAADDGRSPAACAPGDPNPEPGLQDAVPPGASPTWDCGVQPIGFLPGANGAMAVAAHCAYTGGALPDGSGVRVIDVSKPTRPRLVKVLPTSSRELLAARVTPQRAVLVTRRRDTEAQEGQVLGRDMLIDVWNIKACTDPKLVGTLRFPTANPTTGDFSGPLDVQGPAHNLGLNPSATKVYGTLPLQEGDITDLAHPERWTVKDFNCEITNQYFPAYQVVPGGEVCESTENVLPGQTPQYSHEPTFSPDGSRLYVGSQHPYPTTNDMYILDMTAAVPRLVSVTKEAPGHGIDVVSVKRRRYLLHSNEVSAVGCIPDEARPRYFGFGDRAFLLDITDETAPKRVAELVLAESRFTNCGRDGGTGGASVAYHAVDDPLDSTYAVIGFGPAGFRFFDLREPERPVEVAYFNHGPSEHTKPYIIPQTGHIWVSGAGGFWVLALEPHVRQQLGLTTPTKAPAAASPGNGSVAQQPSSGAAKSALPATGGVAAPAAGTVLLAAAGAALWMRRRTSVAAARREMDTIL
jgi:hypothetical protein